MRYKLNDVWHTFVTRVAENPAVAEETIRQLAEHTSQPMLAPLMRISGFRRAGQP
jgi:hypothetical protein